MMKQKMVIKVPMHCQKCYSKALKIAVGVSGVESAALKGDDKSQIEVIGVGVDAAKLATSLRKKMKHAHLVSVGPAGDGGGGEKKEEKKKEEKANEPTMQVLQQPLVWSSCHGGVPCYDYRVVYADPYCESSTCYIM